MKLSATALILPTTLSSTTLPANFIHSHNAVNVSSNSHSSPLTTSWLQPLAVTAGYKRHWPKTSLSNRLNIRTPPRSSTSHAVPLHNKLSRKKQRHNERLKECIHYTHLSSSSKNAVNALLEPLTWITRDDLDTLRTFRFNILGQIGNALLEGFVLMGEVDAGERFLLSHIDIEEERAQNRQPLINAFKEQLPLTVNQKDKVTLRPLQAFSLVSDIESLLPHRRGIYGYELIDHSLDHCMLFIKPGTTLDAFKRAFMGQCGEIGWRLLEAMLAVSFSDFTDQLQHGLLLDLSTWRNHYIDTVTRRVAPKSPTLFNQRHPLGADYFKQLNLETNRSLQRLFSEKQVGKQLLRTPAFQRTLYRHLVCTTIKEHYQARIPTQLPGIKDDLQKTVIELLRQPGMTPQAQRAADALEMGYVDMRLLPYRQFKHACMDLFKEQRADTIRGVADGAQIYVKGSSDSLSYSKISIILHEIIHALDWLDNEAFFSEYKESGFATYTLERRAFTQQYTFMRKMADQNGLDLAPSDYKHPVEMRKFIRSQYQIKK